MTAAELEEFITAHPLGSSPEAQRILKPVPFDEKTYDRERKAKQRASGRELYIPVPKNIERRLSCLSDPELLLTTYFRQTYFEPFTEDRRDMLRSIKRAAKVGGDKAIAGSRGEGKTTLAMDGAFCLMLDGLTFFPVVIGKNQDASSDELKALRERILQSDEFIEDFPEIGIPLQAVGPNTANARLQTVGGQFIGMFLGIKHFALPRITKEQLAHWPQGLDSVANGQVMGAVGIEGRIRGFKFRSHRPTLAIIDDVEDKESVRNDATIEKIETIIEEDIGGMGSSAERIARVYLCTTLNRKCNAFKFTDKAQKPSWNGRRYRKMIKPPDRMDLVQKYIELRQSKADDDEDAREAFGFWKANQKEIEAGCIISNPYSYSKKIHEDGDPIELSAIQAYYNRVADMGEVAVATEIDNDPPEQEAQTLALTHSHIASCKSKLKRKERPEWAKHVVRGIDMGKVECWYVDIAFDTDGTGAVIDYGTFYTHGLTVNASNTAIENAMMEALVRFVEGTEIQIDYALVDSGYKPDAIYEACRKVEGNYFPLKGPDSAYRMPKHKDDGSVSCFFECHVTKIKDQHGRDVDLFHPNTEYWKNWLQERWVLDPWKGEERISGSMALFDVDDTREHTQFAKSMIAERMEKVPLPGKTYKLQWVVVDRRNNHYLDAAGYACAAASCLGVRLIQSETPPIERKIQPKRFVNPWGRPFVARRG